MPTAMKRSCLYPGCGQAQEQGGYCPAHAHLRPLPPSEAQRGSPSARGYGRRWQQLRMMVLRAHPACVVCGEPATDVDHITPKRQGGQDTADNLQPLCHACHSSKTMAETNARRRSKAK
jgi:5-methylcytosine-specific restriction enzyme A